MVFYICSLLALLGGLGLLFIRKPLYGALSFMCSMLGVAVIYFHLGAQFLAGVQLAVYAGAVTVLFIILLMVFDLKESEKDLSLSGMELFMRFVSVGWPLGLFLGALGFSYSVSQSQVNHLSVVSTKEIGLLLFEKYLIPFEVVGVFLLAIAIGAVSIAKWKEVYHESGN